MSRQTTFNGPSASQTQEPDPEGDLHKERPESTYHPGQDPSAERRRQNQIGTLRHGYERLGHMYSLGLPFKFEELQGRHPFDFVEGTKEHFKLHPDPVKRPAQPEDQTLFDVREWLEPLIRKGQLYWDYCRDKWLEKESKIGSACAPIGCMYSLWSVTDSCLQNGGLVFMAVYLILTVIFIIPFIYMELTLGQFHRQGLVKAIKQTCPLFQGVAHLMLLASLFDYLLTMTGATWLLYYLQASVSFAFPWRFCHSYWSSSQCKATLDYMQQNGTYNVNQRTPAVEWFRVHVSRPWNHWETNYGEPTPAQVFMGLLPNPHIIMCFLVLLFVCRELMKMWCRKLGCIMGCIFSLAFVLTSFSLYSNHQTFASNIQKPVYAWFFKEDHMKHFYEVTTWTTALRHAVTSSGIGTGIYITFGSHNTFPNDDLKYLSVLSGLANFTIHFIIGIFFVLCHFTIRTSKPFENATVDNFGSDILFEVFPQVVAQHQQQGFALVMFFMMIAGILLVVMMRATCSLHTIRQFFIDRDKEYYEPCRVNYNYWEHGHIKRQQRYVDLHLSPDRKARLMTTIMLYAGIFHLVTFMTGGSVILHVVQDLWYNYVPMSIIMVETTAVFFFAGVRTLNEYIRKMTTWQATLWYRFAWRTFVPLVLVMYVTNPPRLLDKIGGTDLPEVVHLLGYVVAGLPLFYMYMSIFHFWSQSRAKGFSHKFNLEVTPEHEQTGLIAGLKPTSRLHWMHHMHVPAGISRGLCLPSYDGPSRRPDPSRFDGHYRLLNFFWYTLKFRWFNGIREGCVRYQPEEEIQSRVLHIFPPIPLPMKPPKKQRPLPEYLPNQGIKRVHKLKKYKDFQMQRKQWLGSKVELERERMAAEHNERDIETGIMGANLKIAQDDEREREFFDTFDMSSEDEVAHTSSTESSVISFDPSSDDGRGRMSSPSVSTSDSFDSQNSIFRGSEEDDLMTFREKPVSGVDSESSSEDDDDIDEMLELLEETDEFIGPAMDYGDGDGVPFDDETDSWDLEDLEHMEEDRMAGNNNQETSSAETDTDDLPDVLDESEEISSSEDEDDNEKVPEDPIGKTVAKKEDSEESNSWSRSCGSSSCSSQDGGEGSSSEDVSDDSDSDHDNQNKDGSSSGSPTGFAGTSKSKNQNENLRFFRHMAERLDTFLHISKSREKDKIGKNQEQTKKSRRADRTE